MPTIHNASPIPAAPSDGYESAYSAGEIAGFDGVDERQLTDALCRFCDSRGWLVSDDLRGAFEDGYYSVTPNGKAGNDNG